MYIDKFGEKKGDYCLVADLDNKIIGAVEPIYVLPKEMGNQKAYKYVNMAVLYYDLVKSLPIKATPPKCIFYNKQPAK
ncbi:hypothetical protein FACS189413_01240 [Bacteroidia bacterium]|nr:hypothetical protein FACS189413_01240 [Bacteroidia bacterium]